MNYSFDKNSSKISGKKQLIIMSSLGARSEIMVGRLFRQWLKIDFKLINMLSINIIPQRDSVAGEQCFRSSASIIIVIEGTRGMLSPVASVSFRLSSKTELRFSTHSASKNPSKTSHFYFPDVDSRACLMTFGRIPSFHSSEALSTQPINLSNDCDFGFITYLLIPRCLQLYLIMSLSLAVRQELAGPSSKSPAMAFS